ncbi:MAG: hypothetical protein F6K17_14300 [Okeania sp. SIO3C4]|nr:hypothetical protein [Okeania sp. SIO3C4]
MTVKNYKIKPYGNPNSSNISQTSNPQTPEGKVQAIADFLEVGLKGLILQEYGERALLIQDIQYAMGTDGSQDLGVYKKQMENNFPGMASGNTQPKVDKDRQPELKKVSKEKSVKVTVPSSKGFGGEQNQKRGKK